MIAADCNQHFGLLSRTITLRRAMLAALICCGRMALAAAPDPPADPKPATWNEMRLPEPEGGVRDETTARRMLQGEGTVTNPKLFDTYWRYFCSQITWYDRRVDLPKLRIDLRNQLKGRSGPAQQRLVRQIVFPLMRDIARDEKFDWIVRYNAIMVLGELNQTEPLPPKRAVGFAPTVPVLLEFLDPKRPVNDVNDALRIAALNALQEQAKRGGIADTATREKVVRLLQQISGDQPPASGRLPDVHEWIALRAQEALSTIQGAGPIAAAR